MSTKRLVGYLLLNALVSATVMLSILWLWDRARPAVPRPLVGENTPVVVAGGGATAPPSTTAPLVLASATPTVYVVQPGDTLSSIARQFDVSVESLMAANGLSDPNVLSVGQTLIIPVAVESGTSPTEALPPTPTLEAPLLTATRDPNAPLPRLTIREAIGAGSLADESLVIVNQGGPVELAGWTLRDESGHLYTFPSLTLFTEGAIKVHTTSGVDTVTDLYWGQAEAVWAPGKVVLLSDPVGNLHARFTVP